MAQKVRSGQATTDLLTEPQDGQCDKSRNNVGAVYSIASQKGGTGKSSTSISLAAGLARQGKRVLLVDIDSQANSSKVLIPDYQKLR